MPKQKDLKRVVRTRRRKTGESYTSARVHVLGKRDGAAKKPAAAVKKAAPAKARVTRAAKPSPKAKTDYAGLAGVSDEAMAAKTGGPWEKWVNHLDSFGAPDKPHRE